MESSNSLKLVSLNLEGHKHLDLQVPFFRAQLPDVLCMQEVFESDFSFLKNELGMHGVFAPMCRHAHENGAEIFESWGVAILTKLSMPTMQARYYFGDPQIIHEFVNSVVSPQEHMNKVLMYADVLNSEGTRFSVGTTHFTWTPNGQSNDRQRQDLRALFKELEAIPEIVFCGDFNAPRGGEIFNAIAQRYKDNIPVHYTTSIDGNLHHKGQLEYMVDGLFSTSEYTVHNVCLESGVSDHCATVADIVRDKK